MLNKTKALTIIHIFGVLTSTWQECVQSKVKIWPTCRINLELAYDVKIVAHMTVASCDDSNTGSGTSSQMIPHDRSST